MDGAAAHRRRPRPVADAPVGPLADGIALAKAWLLELVAAAPLHQAAAVPAAELARGGPVLCAAVLAAVRSDDDLARLEHGDRAAVSASAGRLAGARSPAAVAAAVDALRGVAWRALLAEAAEPPAMVADLADRLAFVCARVTELSLSNVDANGRSGPLAEALAAQRTVEVPPADGEAPAVAPPQEQPAPPPATNGDAPPARPVVERRPVQGGAPAWFDAPPLPGGLRAVVPPSGRGDEREERPQDLAAPGPPPEGVLPIAPLGWDVLPPEPPRPETNGGSYLRPVETWGATAADPPWFGAVVRRLARRADDGLPFAVLAVEIDDLDRLAAAESGREVALALEVAERALTAELAPADAVVRERLGRWWLTSPDRDAAGARDLGERVVAAVAQAVLAGVPLTASVGVAVCPDDGEDADDLCARAEQGLFGARAAGVRLS